jgi:hypothetical protein
MLELAHFQGCQDQCHRVTIEKKCGCVFPRLAKDGINETVEHYCSLEFECKNMHRRITACTSINHKVVFLTATEYNCFSGVFNDFNQQNYTCNCGVPCRLVNTCLLLSDSKAVIRRPKNTFCPPHPTDLIKIQS